jgi:hypothetical protein
MQKEKVKTKIADFTDILCKQVFVSSVFICALETVLYINNDKALGVKELLKEVGLMAFDFWRILNSYIKYDPHMPCMIKTHFREIEINIVSEYAWEPESPVVKIIWIMCNRGEEEVNKLQ